MTATTRPAHASGDIRGQVARYLGYHDEQSGGDLGARRTAYADMVRSYYDLATDFYEVGWGDSFHFAPRYEGETFAESIRRHQYWLASKLGLEPGMKVLDVGCGVGGPMRAVARFAGCEVVGINNSSYQVEKVRRYNAEKGLSERCSVVEADFMDMPFEDGTFDAVYAFEATCHAPDKKALFAEILRVLKPGARFGAYEWCLTDRYDEGDAEHRRIKKGIEEGDSLPDIWTIPATEQCLRDAGFSVVETEDRAFASDEATPWFLPITGRERNLLGLRRTKVGRRVAWGLMTVMEGAKIWPKGTRQASEFLHAGADALVEGGETGIFTPMLWLHARKPTN